MKSVPFRQERERLVLQLLDERDTPWIAALLDELELAVGQPWRELLERIERLPARSSSARRAAVLHAMRSFLGGRERGPVRAKQVRRALLGVAPQFRCDNDSNSERRCNRHRERESTSQRLEVSRSWSGYADLRKALGDELEDSGAPCSLKHRAVGVQFRVESQPP